MNYECLEYSFDVCKIINIITYFEQWKREVKKRIQSAGKMKPRQQQRRGGKKMKTVEINNRHFHTLNDYQGTGGFVIVATSRLWALATKGWWYIRKITWRILECVSARCNDSKWKLWWVFEWGEEQSLSERAVWVPFSCCRSACRWEKCV